jgi:1,2-diacylglycerol 3-beta-glucosyltransferase
MALTCIKLILTFADFCLAAYVMVNVAYCLWLLIVAAATKAVLRGDKRVTLPTTRFCLLIPAHDEELVIGGTLNALSLLRYPRELLRIVVIADNCTDRTATLAAGVDGVTVLERRNPDQRGKGYALNWALDQLSADDGIDTFVIMDADTHMDSLFLHKMDCHRMAAKAPLFVAQGRYDVLNPDSHWRTALMAGALSLIHVVRPFARERLGLTVGLKGNGMCFDRDVMRKLAWRGDSLAEDLEYTLDLLEKLDTRVCFVPSARVAALMPTESSGASSQRKRWEDGRKIIVRQRAARLFFTGIARQKPTYIDAALDLWSPPLAQLGAAFLLWAAFTGICAIVGDPWNLLVGLTAATGAALIVYVLGGFLVGDAPPGAYRALVYAPFYAIWKLSQRVIGPKQGGAWVRTARESAHDLSDSSGQGDLEEIEDPGVFSKAVEAEL